MSSGMLRHVALVRTDVPEKLRTSINGVTTISELGTTLAVTSNLHMLRRISPILVTLMMEALSSSETSVLTRAIWRNITEDGILYNIIRFTEKQNNEIYMPHTQLHNLSSAVSFKFWLCEGKVS
jgi:hypothetical protein